MSPQFLDSGDIFCPPQHFVMKSIVVVEISCLHYCWKLLPSIKAEKMRKMSTITGLSVDAV